MIVYIILTYIKGDEKMDKIVDEKVIDELFEELTEEAQFAEDANCGGSACLYDYKRQFTCW